MRIYYIICFSILLNCTALYANDDEFTIENLLENISETHSYADPTVFFPNIEKMVGQITLKYQGSEHLVEKILIVFYSLQIELDRIVAYQIHDLQRTFSVSVLRYMQLIIALFEYQFANYDFANFNDQYYLRDVARVYNKYSLNLIASNLSSKIWLQKARKFNFLACKKLKADQRLPDDLEQALMNCFPYLTFINEVSRISWYLEMRFELEKMLEDQEYSASCKEFFTRRLGMVNRELKMLIDSNRALKQRLFEVHHPWLSQQLSLSEYQKLYGNE